MFIILFKNRCYEEEYDFIVVGTGSSGSVLASKLAQLKKAKILVLEAGGSNNLSYIHDFRESLYLPENFEQWDYKTVKHKNLNGREMNVPMSKMLGGNSSINQCLFVRGSPDDFNYWPSLWSYENVLENYKNIETVECNKKYNPEFRGNCGPVRVSSYQSEKNKLARDFLDAAVENGYTPIQDYNEPFEEEEICSFMQYNISPRYPNYRWDSFSSFLEPILSANPGNISLKTNAHVKRVLVKNKRTTGVEYVHQGMTFIAKARREVILCCGAINTPKLLQLSGIGDKKLMKKLNIPLVHHLPAVGKNLQDHLVVFVFYKLKEKLPDDHTNLVDVNMFVKGQDGRYPLQMYSICFPKDVEEFNAKNIWYGAESILNIPYSKGSVEIQDDNYLSNPKIDYNYLSDKRDYDIIINGIRRLRNIFQSMSSVQGEAQPGIEFQTDKELIPYIQKNAYSICHCSCTCKMTEEFDESQSVVNPFSKVWGIEGLRIADASIMPEIMSANLNATCMMIGDRVGDFIIQEYNYLL